MIVEHWETAMKIAGSTSLPIGANCGIGLAPIEQALRRGANRIAS